jgi:hypothetical protein
MAAAAALIETELEALTDLDCNWVGTLDVGTAPPGRPPGTGTVPASKLSVVPEAQKKLARKTESQRP